MLLTVAPALLQSQRMKMLSCCLLIFLPLLPNGAHAAPGEFTLEVTESKVLENLDVEGVRSFATVLGLPNEERAFKTAQSSKADFNKLKLLRLSELQALTNTRGGAWFAKIRSSVASDIKEFVTNSGLKMTNNVGVLRPTDNHEMPRYFDVGWLTSKYAAFKMVAVVNRVDRKDFDADSCGELRFIYRLGYYQNTEERGHNVEQFSVLPFFLNVVYLYTAGDCAAVANLWKLNRSSFATPEAFSQALQNGPLNPALSRLKQIELNMQTVRFSSGDKVDFGGQAIYLFRIFNPDESGRLVETPLENTPDVTALLNDKRLRDDLLAQLSNPENFEAIDKGLFKLNNTEGRLLATRAFSFSTVGRARLGNKPFSFLFLNNGKADGLTSLKSLPYARAEFVKSPSGLIERMNNLSCIGCHQSNGTAGFHMLGRFFEMDTKTNRTALPFSPHFYSERFRKSRYLEVLAGGGTPNRFRPHSMYPPANWSTAPSDELPSFVPAHVKELCLPESQDFSVSIPCGDPNATCVINARNPSVGIQFGECMYKKEKAALVTAGLSCREGTISNGMSVATSTKNSSLPFNFFSFKDQYIGPIKESVRMPSPYYKLSSDLVCGLPKGGVPVGRVRKQCTEDSPTGRIEWADQLLANPSKPTEDFELPKEICAVRGGSHIDECAATDHVAACLKEAVVPRSMLDVCYNGHFCREDYLCQQLPLEIANYYKKDARQFEVMQKRLIELNRRNIGFCVPNYFVFNMRIDGHPLPK